MASWKLSKTLGQLFILPRIFFYQVGDHTTRADGGVGPVLHLPVPVRAPPGHSLQQLGSRQRRHVDDAGRQKWPSMQRIPVLKLTDKRLLQKPDTGYPANDNLKSGRRISC